MTPSDPREPDRDCGRCPRLAAYRAENRGRWPSFFNAPVPAAGPSAPSVLVVGLAPALRGANRTGVPFEGDDSGTFLHAGLARAGLDRAGLDRAGLAGPAAPALRITNAVRCVPPGNRPSAAEIAACRDFLRDEIAATRPRCVLALGRVAHEAVVAALGRRRGDHGFSHGARHEIGALALHDSYHPSRQNTRTGRLTAAMFDDVLARLARDLRA